MHTNPAVMRSLAVAVVIALTTWTLTDAEKVSNPCCVRVSTVELKEPIKGFTIQRKDLPCITAVIFETEKGHFCVDPRQTWVQKKVKEIVESQKKKASATSPPSPSRPVSPRLFTSTIKG